MTRYLFVIAFVMNFIKGKVLEKHVHRYVLFLGRILYRKARVNFDSGSLKLVISKLAIENLAAPRRRLNMSNCKHY